MVRKIEWRAVFVICLIAGIFETISMTSGYLLTRIPFFSASESEDLKDFCYFVAAILFLLIAAYMIYNRDGVCVYLHGRDRLGVYRT